MNDKANQGNPMQDKPVQQSPTQQSPTQQIPAQQSPAQQSPTQQIPAQQNPTQQIPAQQNPTQQTPTQQTPTQQGPTQQGPVQDSASKPARPKGPNAAAVVLGLVAVLLGGLIIAKESMNLRVDWSQLGPGAIVGVGVLLVALGAIGLARRHDDT